MRVTRALWASFGAGMCITVTGVVLLAAVSTVVAFRGWPGADLTQPSTPPAMLAEVAGFTEPDDAATDAKPIVVPAAPARSTRRATTNRRRSASATNSSGKGSTRVATTEPTSGTAVPPVPVAPASQPGASPAAPPSKAPAAAPKVGDGVRDLGSAVDAGAGNVTGALGDAVEPVSPTVGKTVGGVGEVVGDTVQGVTNVVAGVVDALTAPR